jgi:hypothetical protein
VHIFPTLCSARSAPLNLRYSFLSFVTVVADALFKNATTILEHEKHGAAAGVVGAGHGGHVAHQHAATGSAAGGAHAASFGRKMGPEGGARRSY